MPDSTPQPKRLSTRLLYPFRFATRPTGNDPTRSCPEPDTIDAMVAGLCNHRLLIAARDEALPAWEYCRLPPNPTAGRSAPETGTTVKELYTQEFLPHAVRFLFGGEGQRTGRCLQMPQATLAALFQGRISVWPKGRQAWLNAQDEPAKMIGSVPPEAVHTARHEARIARLAPLFIDRITGLELFVNGLGVGVLSFAFDLEGGIANSLELHSIRNLLYVISHRQRYRAVTLSRYHEQDEPQRWQRIPQAQKTKVVQPPATDATLTDRLGRKGGDYALQELFRLLVEPISSHPAAAFDDHHQLQFSHHSVVLFDDSVEFRSDPPHSVLSGELSALTQLEEIGHAGAAPGEITVASSVLNSRHVAAAGSQGSVHFIADQPPNDPGRRFNDSRVTLVHNKYFIDFLLAFLQDQYLQKAAAECADLVAAITGPVNETSGACFAALRHEVLAFDALCHLTHISSREAHARYYQLVQRGLRIPAAMEGVYGQLSDLDALCKFHQQSEQSTELVAINKQLIESGRRQEAHQHALVSMQGKIEWVELFLVGVYSVYLTHYLGENFCFKHIYVGWAILAIAAFAAVLAAWLLKPWAHAVEAKQATAQPDESAVKGSARQRARAPHRRSWWTAVAVLASIIVVVVGYLGLGFAHFHRADPECGTSQHLSSVFRRANEAHLRLDKMPSDREVAGADVVRRHDRPAM